MNAGHRVGSVGTDVLAPCVLLLIALASCGRDGIEINASPPTAETPNTGTLVVTINPPSSSPLSVQVSGPGGFARTLSATQTLIGLPTGTYVVDAPPVQTDTYGFSPLAAQQAVSITPAVTTTVSVDYAATSGALSITSLGLPADRSPNISITGPSGALTVGADRTIGRLPGGTYTIAPQPVGDVSLRYIGANRTLAVVAGVTTTVSIAYGLNILQRSVSDRSDDASGAQLKVLYVMPSDGIDRGLDSVGVLQRSVASWQRWLAAQTGGRFLRLDTFAGGLDVQFVRLPRTDATYTAYGALLRDSLERDLMAMGTTTNAQKLYLAYYEGGHVDRCGSAAWPPVRPGRVAALYLHGTMAGGPNCDTNAFAISATSPPGYLEFVAAHESLHLLGVVSAAAPDHGLAGHVITDPNDLMYAGALPWTPSRIDQARRNYFNPAGLGMGLINLATSAAVITP